MMSDIADEHQELPSYGQNGRDLILKVARLHGATSSVLLEIGCVTSSTVRDMQVVRYLEGGYTSVVHNNSITTALYVHCRLLVSSSLHPAGRPGSGALLHSLSPTTPTTATAQQCHQRIDQPLHTIHVQRSRALCGRSR